MEWMGAGTCQCWLTGWWWEKQLREVASVGSAQSKQRHLAEDGEVLLSNTLALAIQGGREAGVQC